MTQWKHPKWLRMKSDWTQEWKVFSAEEQVVGVKHENREQAFLLMGDRPDFQVTLVRQPTNPRDKNAIKVVGAATVKGFKVEKQLEHLSRDTARVLGGETNLTPNHVGSYCLIRIRSILLS